MRKRYAVQGGPVTATPGTWVMTRKSNKLLRATRIHSDNSQIERPTFSSRLYETLAQSTGLGPPSPELYRHATLPHAPRTVLQRLGRVYWFDNLALTFEPCPSESAGYSSPSTKHVVRCSDFWQRLLTVYAGAEAYSRRLMPQDTHLAGVKKRDPRFWEK